MSLPRGIIDLYRSGGEKPPPLCAPWGGDRQNWPLVVLPAFCAKGSPAAHAMAHSHFWAENGESATRLKPGARLPAMMNPDCNKGTSGQKKEGSRWERDIYDSLIGAILLKEPISSRIHRPVFVSG